jgi:uncharacterized membrane protein
VTPTSCPSSATSEASRPKGWRTAVALTAIACAPALLLLAQSERWEWLGAFLGRFHLSVLHFPIALLLLAAVVEVIETASRGRWRFPVGFLLLAGSTGAVAAATLGWLHLQAERIEGPLAEQHMRGGIAVAALSVTLLFVRTLPAAGTRATLRWSYRVLLATTCLLLVRTAHDGGSLVHGEDFLVEHAPWRKPPPAPAIAFPTDQPVAQWDLYAHVVAPILQARCYECHRGGNVKGGLVLETWDALQRGGKSGPALVSGEPAKSLMFQRLELPAEHKEHMPPRRKPQPAPEEIALLRRWIQLGAPEQGTLGDLGLDTRLLAAVSQLPALLQAAAQRPGAETDPAEADPAAVATLRAGLAPQVERLQAAYPHVLGYESRQSPYLRVNAAPLGAAFGDDDLAALAVLRDRIRWADFSGTAITDRSAPVLGSLRHLRVLRLARTEVTDTTVLALASLGELESLTLFGTGITPAALPALARLPSLQRLYVGGTQIAPDTPLPESLRGKLWFHPVPDPATAGAQALR